MGTVGACSASTNLLSVFKGRQKRSKGKEWIKQGWSNNGRRGKGWRTKKEGDRNPAHLMSSTVQPLLHVCAVYAADNCDFYPTAYPGFDYFTGVHHGSAAEFLTPPPPPPPVPPPPVSSGPLHVGPPPHSAPLGDHGAPRELQQRYQCLF